MCSPKVPIKQVSTEDLPTNKGSFNLIRVSLYQGAIPKKPHNNDYIDQEQNSRPKEITSKFHA